MELLGLLCCAPLALLFWVVVQSLLFRGLAYLVGGVTIGWPMAAVTVVCAAIVQSLFTGLFFGADLGLCGSIAGFLVWTAVLGGLTELSWPQAMVVGLLMTVVTWAIGAVVVGILLVTGAAALLGLAALLAL